MKHTGTYPDNWPDIARGTKKAAGWRCVRCGHPHETPGAPVPCDEGCDPRKHAGGLNSGKQRVLTVHHLDGDKSNVAWWNLAALCQVCHLIIQGKVVMDRPWLMLPHSPWFRPYVAGFYAHKYLGASLTRTEVEAQIDQLLQLELAHFAEVCR